MKEELEVLYNENNYNIIKNYKEGYDTEEIKKRYTDYFSFYDYVVGDWAYGKLRLKGFYKPENKKSRDINNYKNVEKYLKENCAHDCRYFILEKK